MSWIKAMREKEPPEPNNPIGTVVIGNLQPDRMDTPKNMVRRSLKLAQFKTVDLGAAAHERSFAKKAKEVDADIIAVSINLSSAKGKLPNLISAIENEGMKMQTKSVHYTAKQEKKQWRWQRKLLQKSTQPANPKNELIIDEND